MKQHTITLEEATAAMEQEVAVHIASSFRANHPVSKKLEYLPAQKQFRLTFKGDNGSGVRHFTWTEQAVEAYNSVGV